MKDFEYKVTMIVPIYNMEDFLRDCLDSLVNQTISLSEMEILLIDDGSPDNSIDIMEEYAEKYPCMKILRKENEGLSMTRNYGIKHARGKYIMYIDADDRITPETVKSVTDFFDKHYDEVDLVSYKEIPVVNGEEGKPHYRYNMLVQSGVYDLNLMDNAFIAQTRVNVCVKNMGEDNVLFDTDREFRHEDQKYCTEILRKKMKLGYCSKGSYLYLHQPASIVRTYFYAYYIFEKTMKFWEDLFADYKDAVPNYIQALYLNDISWKTVRDILLPYHYEEKKFKEAKNRIKLLLNRVSDEVILRHPGVDNFHRQFFINLKDGNDIKLYSGANNLVVMNHDKVIYSTNKIQIILRSFQVRGNKIKIIAFLKSAAFNYVGKPVLYMIENRHYERPKKVALRESSWSYYRAKTKTNHFWLFQLEIDTNRVRSFEFKVEIDGKRFDASYHFMPQVYFNRKYKRTSYFKDGMEYRFHRGRFYIGKADPEKEREQLKKIRNKYRKSNKRLWMFRNICSRKIAGYDNVWLYYDCKGVRKDNGYYQFIHDFDKKDGVSRYYIVNDDLDKVKDLFTAKQRRHLVRFGSTFHKFLFLKARKIITAYIEENNYIPFKRKEYMSYMDVNSQADIIYLQHGVLHAHVPWKYSLDRLGIEKEVISTHYEKENLIQNYCFSEKSLIPCGMPRYDYIDPAEESVNRILFAPSWRKYLVGMDETGWITTEGKFLQSKFFEETTRFLNSEELQKLLEEHDFYLDFKLHPILERYKHLYKITNSRVTMAESVISETKYKIFMTDFSSFVFDFVYLEKPIVYFLPDDEMFRAGMNDYREIDIPFEDAFGDLALTAEEAVDALRKVFGNGCKPEEKYAAKMKNFFFYKDNAQRDRLYQALIEED